jgi:phosphatidylserine/phosphatidylglycerophosphate/cardiolipin synthase-like enzyme
MSAAVRTLLVFGLAQHLRGMSEPDARIMAHELTLLVSAEVARLPATSSSPRLPCFPREAWNELTVGVPWEAYSYAYGALKGEATGSGVKALCSAPAHLDPLLAGQAVSSGLWGGSLLVALGEILEGVHLDLTIFSPYWRIDGVRSMLSTAGRKNYKGVKVRVFTQPAAWMKTDDRDGLSFFVETMRAAGAEVRVFAPATVDGITPFLHAKLVIADAAIAYVGSANFTSSGLDHGLEAGVLVEGEAANAFARWAGAIEAACEPWWYGPNEA